MKFAAINKQGFSVSFNSNTWEYAELLCKAKGYKQLGVLIKEIAANT